ncbi:HHL216Wp [Eremothecium sinecaudum]|uniref:HHL216Wp n=1 Tax=Eremothecium sinecaudum TaxID=45286 RepID=A0A0X8HW70_9SACH|nr:HHL216Wp [Eremothecium sinecaudum]AMD22554.1 HHL216Wp [Eremothecium sinecaudum]
MSTPNGVLEAVKRFQKEPLEENRDYMVLQQAKNHVERRLPEMKYLSKQMQQLYQLLDKTRNYQEFVDVLMNNGPLLQEIFMLERHTQRKPPTPRINWRKFGLDVEEYLIENHMEGLGADCGWAFND